MKLEIGKQYWNGGGKRYFIAGVTAEYPWIVWSRCGDWFDINTGQFISGVDQSNKKYLTRAPMWRDLWSEASVT